MNQRMLVQKRSTGVRFIYIYCTKNHQLPLEFRKTIMLPLNDNELGRYNESSTLLLAILNSCFVASVIIHFLVMSVSTTASIQFMFVSHLISSEVAIRLLSMRKYFGDKYRKWPDIGFDGEGSCRPNFRCSPSKGKFRSKRRWISLFVSWQTKVTNLHSLIAV